MKLRKVINLDTLKSTRDSKSVLVFLLGEQRFLKYSNHSSALIASDNGLFDFFLRSFTISQYLLGLFASKLAIFMKQRFPKHFLFGFD